MEFSEEDFLGLFNRLFERLQQTGLVSGSNTHLHAVYVAKGGQYVNTQVTYPQPLPKGGEKGPQHDPPQREDPLPGPPQKGRGKVFESPTEVIRHSIGLLMQERYGEEVLFNQQSHWQAVYRILVDKGYCRDSDFDGFDIFIRSVMPEEVNKPYSKGSVKQISQTDFVRPFEEWKYDAQTSKTRKPFERMVAVASRFKSILEENGV